MLRRSLVVLGFALALPSCKSPEDKAKEAVVGTWKGNVTIVGAPPVEVTVSFHAGGRYQETRTVQGIQGLSMAGGWALAGTKAISMTPDSAPPPNPMAALPAARALMPFSGTIAFHLYSGEQKIRVGDVDLSRGRLGAARSGELCLRRSGDGHAPRTMRSISARSASVGNPHPGS